MTDSFQRGGEWGYWLKEGEVVGLRPCMHRTLNTDNSMLMARGGGARAGWRWAKGRNWDFLL